ncbi:hypothetical protein ACRAWD_19645 [Caulobacter segnis]
MTIDLEDRHAAAAFRRLVQHLRMRTDARERRPDGPGRLLPQLPGRLGRGGLGRNP